MVTAAPSRAICRAMAFPMPLSAPVMIATLFCNRMATSSALVGLSRPHRSANYMPAQHPCASATSLPWAPQTAAVKELPHLPHLILLRLAVPERPDIHDLGQARLPED